MRGYGLPRFPGVEYPDPLDIQGFGLKSSIGQVVRESGEYRSYTRSSKSRRQVRIYWKRRERNRIKLELNKYL